MPFTTAHERRIRRLFHWQRFNAEWFEAQLKNGTIYCSNPKDFNDPWDCRPFFNTDILGDPGERQKHIDWAVKICKRAGQMSEAQIAEMQRQLQDPAVLERCVREQIIGTRRAVLDRYRVYCLCPDVNSIRMWAHYADNHKGICLEFNVPNEIICGALEVQYYDEFPMTRQYSDDIDENLLPLLVKSKAWKDENEYRLIAQEAGNATPHETLLTHGGHLKLHEGALQSVIVGCQGPYDTVKELVAKYQVNVQVLRARTVPNRYELVYEP